MSAPETTPHAKESYEALAELMINAERVSLDLASRLANMPSEDSMDDVFNAAVWLEQLLRKARISARYKSTKQ